MGVAILVGTWTDQHSSCAAPFAAGTLSKSRRSPTSAEHQSSKSTSVSPMMCYHIRTILRSPCPACAGLHRSRKNSGGSGPRTRNLSHVPTGKCCCHRSCPWFSHIRSPQISLSLTYTRARTRTHARPALLPPPSPSLSVSARLYPLQLRPPVSKGAPVLEARLPSSRTPHQSHRRTPRLGLSTHDSDHGNHRDFDPVHRRVSAV